VSATTGQGLPALLAELGSQLRPEREFLELRVPHAEAAVIARLHAVGQVVQRNYRGATARFKVRLLSISFSRSFDSKVLTHLIQNLQLHLGEALEREELKADAYIATLYLPQQEVAERILRFGSALERQLFNCIAELRRLQREQRQRIATIQRQSLDLLLRQNMLFPDDLEDALAGL
jgi:hypothetical protein